MTPLHHLLVTTEMSQSEAAVSFLHAGRAFGATIETLSGAKLRRWALGHTWMPAWAHRTAYALALGRNWPLDNDEAIGIAMRTYRAMNPAATLEQFRSDHPTLVDQPSVVPMWIEVGARFQRKRTADRAERV